MIINQKHNIILNGIDYVLGWFVKILLGISTYILPKRFSQQLCNISSSNGAIRNILGLLIFNAIGGLLIMVTNVKLANGMGAAMYGLFSYYLAIGEVGSNFVRYGRHKTMLRELIQKPEESRSLIKHTFWLGCINLLLFILIALVFHDLMQASLSITYILLIVAPCLISIDFQPVYEAEKLMSWHSIYYLIQKFCFLGGVWFIIAIDIRLELSAIAIILFISWLMVFIMQYREVVIRGGIQMFYNVRLSKIIDLYKSGFVIALCCIVGVAFGPLIRMIMNTQCNSESVGVYSAGLQLMAIARFFIVQIGRVGNPQMAKVCTPGYDIKQRCLFVYKYSLIMLACTVPFSVLMFLFPVQIVNLLFSAEYAVLSEALPVFSIYIIICSLGIVYNQYMISIRADNYYLTIYSSTALLSILIAYILIPNYGFMGGVYAYCFSDGVASILYMLFSIKKLKN